MKKPPDVLCFGERVRNPKVENFIALMNWAKRNGDDYLYDRATEAMLKELFNQNN